MQVMSIVAQQRRFAVDEYYAMAETGILSADERVELLEGVIVPMSPIGVRHAACVMRLSQLLYDGVRRRANVSVQGPLRIDERTELQPDLMLLAWRDDFYATRHPAPADVLLLIEVSDTTVTFDRVEKRRVYARAGISEVWLVNLPEQRVETYADPHRARYRRTHVARSGAALAPGALPDLSLPVSQVLAAAAGRQGS